MSRPFVRVVAGLGLALVVHLALQPFIARETRDTVALVVVFSVISFRGVGQGDSGGEAKRYGRIAGAVLCGVVCAGAWRLLEHFPGAH